MRWAKVGRFRLRNLYFGKVGAILGFLGGALVGTLSGMLWISVFPPDRTTGGPEAGFDNVFGAGLAGEAIGMLAGLVLGLRWGVTKLKEQ